MPLLSWNCLCSLEILHSNYKERKREMENRPNHKTLLNAVHCWANNDWDFVLKFPNKSSTIFNPNRLSTVLKCKKYCYYCYCFHLVLCHFLPSSNWKPKSPFLCSPGNKGGIYLETYPLPRTQRMWTDHQVPLTQAPNQLSGRYCKWDAVGGPLKGSSQPCSWRRRAREKGEDQRASWGCFPAESVQHNIGSGSQRLPEQFLPRVEPDHFQVHFWLQEPLALQHSPGRTKPLSHQLWPLTTESSSIF